ncbi:unnamed protein product [Musa acuminata var. zebrina]
MYIYMIHIYLFLVLFCIREHMSTQITWWSGRVYIIGFILYLLLLGYLKVAHKLGKTLSAFQPTIRELQICWINFLCHRKCRGTPRAPLSVRSDLMKLELFYMLTKKGKQLLIHVTEE